MNNTPCQSLENLLQVISTLTGPDGCPWDREQTPETLADYLIEEAHELASAIRTDNPAEAAGELGDLAFLLLMVAHFYEKQGKFSLADCLDGAAAKMIRRHPHVFAQSSFDSLGAQLAAWEKIKKEEKLAKGDKSGLFGSLPASLPPMIKAYRINSKAAREGFTWQEDEDVEQQVESEWLEWLDACAQENPELERHELGDLLFSLVELGRRKGIKANEALDLACMRFLQRYAIMEEEAAKQGRDLAAMSLDEKDELWNLAKTRENGKD